MFTTLGGAIKADATTVMCMDISSTDYEYSGATKKVKYSFVANCAKYVFNIRTTIADNAIADDVSFKTTNGKGKAIGEFTIRFFFVMVDRSQPPLFGLQWLRRSTN